MKKVRLESALIDAMHILPEAFEQDKYFLIRQAVYILKELNAPTTRTVMLLSCENNMAKLPLNHISTTKVLPGNALNLSKDKVYSYMLYSSFLDNVNSIEYSDQDSMLVLATSVHTITLVFDGLMEDEFGDIQVYDIFIPAISSYILWRKIRQKKIEAAFSKDQGYYVLRDQEASLKKEYELHIVNARAKMRMQESDRKNKFNSLTRRDDYDEYTQ